MPSSSADTLAALAALFGPWGVVAGVALHFGVPFVEKLIENAANKTPVTPENWAALRDKIAIPGDVLVPQRPLTITVSGTGGKP